jgi:lysozyme
MWVLDRNYRVRRGLFVGLLLCGAATARAGAIRQPGIDVSHFQDTIDWSQVAASGEEFAYVKATQGLNTNDAQFTANMAGAKAAGLAVGAYHFADPELTGHTPALEVAHFLGVAESYIGPGYLPPVVDIETSGGTTITTDTSLSAWVNDFCADVQAATGVDPIVYTLSSYSGTFLDSSVTTHKLWIQDYSGADPDTSSIDGVWGVGNWSFFQYSDSGTVNGIDDAVDLDQFNGTEAQLQALVVTPEPACAGVAGLLLWGLGRRGAGRKRPG